MEKKSLKETLWLSKPCDLCHSNNIQQLGTREYTWPTRQASFVMKLTDSNCNNCGYFYVSKIPDETFLSEYYRNAYYYDIDDESYQPDYDVEKRLAIISEYLSAPASILEIGDNNGFFTQKLQQQGYRASGVDLLEKETAENTEQVDVLYSYDAVISYFVLEHITQPDLWLANLKAQAHQETIFIIEIPDFERFPHESLNHEHFLHCSPFQLHLLMQKNGFKTIKLSRELCSRYFGFVGVFCLASDTRYSEYDISPFQHNMLENQEFYHRGIEQKKAYDDKILKLCHQLIDSTNSSAIVLWGANEHASDIANQLRALNSSLTPILVDGNKQKQSSTHLGFSQPTLAPEQLLGHTSPLTITICAIYAYDIIHAYIEESFVEKNYQIMPKFL